MDGRDTITAQPANPPANDDLLAGLTDPQREAVLHDRGPLLILAAAGSGKTRVITRRIAHMVRERDIAPWQVLALTFTNKAAGEMRERVQHLLLGPDAPEDAQDRRLRGLTVSTFHSLCARLLRRYAAAAELPGLKPDYSVYDTADQMTLMKRTIAALDLSTTNWPPRSVLSAISNAKNELLDAADFEARAGDFYSKQIAKIYKAYDAAMKQAGAVDFDDLLLLTARMLRTRPEIADECRRRWRHLMIDEYQDTNRAQFEIARLIAGDGADATAQDAPPEPDPFADLPGVDAEPEPDRASGRGSGPTPKGPNICVVGDPDQSIYGWRGADIANILDFETHYPSARTIMLGENFRSTGPILHAADTLIKLNTRRKDKPLFTSRPGGTKPQAVLCRDELHEAELVADWFRSLHAGTTPVDAAEPGSAARWSEMAVFYRTNALSRVIEDALRTGGIPYTIARGTAFFDREEVKTAVAYLRVVANTADDVSLERVVNTPARGVGKAAVERVRTAAADAGRPMFDALRLAASGDPAFEGVSSRAVNGVQRFVELVDAWNGAGSFMGAQISGSLAELVERVIEESGLRAHYVKRAAASGSESDEERLDNLDELISSARQFEEEFDIEADPVLSDPDGLAAGEAAEEPALLALLRGYLESVALVADADAVDGSQGSVTLMTLHAAKGLEFPVVAMVGCEEGTLPHSRALESEASMEEERRLAFVGITRAMRRLMLTSAKYRTVRGMRERTIPSRFINEIGPEALSVSDQSDAYDGFSDGAYVDRTGDDGERVFQRPGAAGGASGGAPAARSRGGAPAFPPGATVRHPQFGVGTVREVNGSGASARVVIEFKGVGKKTLVAEYARLTRVK